MKQIRLAAVVFLFAILTIVNTANATPVLYNFQLNNPYHPYSFTYLSPDGFVTPEANHDGSPSWGPVQISKNTLLEYFYDEPYFYGISFFQNFAGNTTQLNAISFISSYMERFFYFPLGSFDQYGVHTDLMGGLSTLTVTPTPEPSTMLLVGGGLAGLVFWRRRIRK